MPVRLTFPARHSSEQAGQPERLPFARFNGYTVGNVFGDSGVFLLVHRPVTLDDRMAPN
jgi:hypothetical protein